jgi:predicted  nucleic acid-binding Zn-ribbon protein
MEKKVLDTLTEKRETVINYISAEIAKNPCLKKAFDDLGTVNGAIEKAQQQLDLEKAQEEEDALEKAEAEKEKSKADLKKEIQDLIDEEADIEEAAKTLAEKYSIDEDVVEDMIAEALETDDEE